MKSTYNSIKLIFSYGTCKGILHLLLLSCILTLSACGGKSTKETPEEDTVVIDSVAMASVLDSIAESETKQEKAPAIPLITDPHIIVDKPNVEIRVVKGGQVVFRAPIACGRVKGQKKFEKDRRTPEGNFQIVSIEDATHKLYRADDGRLIPHVYGPWFLRLDADGWGGIGIHGTSAPGQIGHRVSKGCIRLHNKDIIKLHEYARVGMQVIVLADNTTDPDVYFPSPSPAKTQTAKTEEAETEQVEAVDNGAENAPENVATSPEVENPAPAQPAPAQPAPAPVQDPAPAPAQPPPIF